MLARRGPATRVARASPPAAPIWRRIYQWRHPDHPWLAPGAIAYLDEHLSPDMTGLEWGSGRSTAWFAARLRHLVTVEHDPSWHATVAEQLARAAVTNVDLRLITVEEDEARRQDEHWQHPPYVQVLEEFSDGSLGFVLVDGLYRQECVARALPKLASGGLLVVDQAAQFARLEDWLVPKEWPVAYRHPNPRLDTVIWRKP